MSSTYTGLASGSLLIQKYTNFRGVDFNDETTSLYRSPDSLNMWKNYKSLGQGVETRPGSKFFKEYSNTIYGLFFYTINKVDHMIIHVGTSLYDYNPTTKEEKTLKSEGMNPFKSKAFIYQNIFYILDGLHYYEYDGETFKEVVGTVPLTTIAIKPSGGGTSNQNVNMLSDYRKNSFWSDGESTEYHLDANEIDSVESVWITNPDTGVDVLQSSDSYSVDLVNGIVTFKTAPIKAISSDNVIIQYKKHIGDRDKVNRCKFSIVFDNRIFLSGNEDYPNAIFYSGLNDPRYIPDINYITDGSSVSPIMGLAVGNNALWSFKKASHEDTTIFYHQPAETVDEYTNAPVKAYPTINSTIQTGCEATGINFNDDIVFFSNRGMEGVQNNLNTETVIGHRSTLIDRKLLNEENYKNMILVEWQGYLLVIIDSRVYLADSRQKITNNDHYEYEWFYWQFDKSITFSCVHNDVLYLCTSDYKIYTLEDISSKREIKSYWTTSKDDYNYPQMLKTTNKKGFKTDCTGNKIKIEVKTDNNEFEILGEYEETKGYIIAKLKRKKWNKIQLKYSSDTPFYLREITLEAYVGSYVKRN